MLRRRIPDPEHGEFPATGSGLLDKKGMQTGQANLEYLALLFHDGTNHLGDLLGLSGQHVLDGLSGMNYGIRWAANSQPFPANFWIEPVSRLGLPGTDKHPDVALVRDPTVKVSPWATYDFHRRTAPLVAGPLTVASTDRLFRLDLASGETGYLIVEATDRVAWVLPDPHWHTDPNSACLPDIRVRALVTETIGPVTLPGNYYLRADDLI